MDLGRGTIALADGCRLSAPVVIGADGATSPVAKALFGAPMIRRGSALRWRWSARAPMGLRPRMWRSIWGRQTGAMAGPSPRRDRTLGLGGVHARNPDLRRAFDGFAARHGADLQRLACKGAFLPFGEVREVPGRGRCCSRATHGPGRSDHGRGHRLGDEERQLAAEAAAVALARGQPDTALRRYSTALRPVQAELRRARALRWLALSAAPAPGLSAAAGIRAGPAAPLSVADFGRSRLRRSRSGRPAAPCLARAAPLAPRRALTGGCAASNRQPTVPQPEGSSDADTYRADDPCRSGCRRGAGRGAGGCGPRTDRRRRLRDRGRLRPVGGRRLFSGAA